MKRVAVVIPFFQREPGILRHALESVYAQELGADVAVEIVIADDASPTTPEPEIEGLSRPNFSVRVIKRENGGPAAARNTALDAITDTDVIAFIDSDDLWAPGHLRAGLAALDAGVQFYFADNRYDEQTTWFAAIADMPAIIMQSQEIEGGARMLTRDQAMPHFLRHCLSHTSTVIYDARRLGRLRFDEGQAIAGEDHLYWLAAVDRSERVAFNLDAMGARGRGVDIYRRALDWSHPECVRRLHDALLAHKLINQRFCRTPEQKQYGAAQVAKLRRSISYLLVRNAFRHPLQNARVVARLLRTDPASVLLLPVNAPLTLLQRAQGRLDFWAG